MSDTDFNPFEQYFDRSEALKILKNTCAGADDGELFIERRRSENLMLDDSRLKSANFDASEGFGLRAVRGEVTGYAHSTEMTEAALKRASDTVGLAAGQGKAHLANAPSRSNRALYDSFDPTEEITFSAKVDLLKEIDDYLRILDKRVVQVSASIATNLQEIMILRPEDEIWVMDIVLGPGWPGILLHEAVGHGLEGDFNRKGTSAFAGLLGQQVAAKGVTVVDDGTLPNRRGSITIDDEGTPSSRNVLIEGGILVGFMQDRQNARLMGVDPTGNGRRQSYAHAPMPRMTNTIMEGGAATPAELLSDLKDGIYAVGFGGGQVDITNGKFVFSCTEAYRVKNGQVGTPIKGATLIGDGATALKHIRGLGNDMELDPGMGTCGKSGQWVPVGVGQPSVLIGGLTVGGSGAAR
ncbi:MAG: metalloprotease TldD [Rhodobacteraceae bacterium]|nr:metalloprotease TldD [Paracoccaceae bacterium]